MQVTVPAYAAAIRLEAEVNSAGAKVADDAQASGGRAVSSTRDYSPLFIVPVTSLPAGESLTFWVRHKGGPLQLKAITGQSKREFKWLWDKPAQWKWSQLATVPRAQMGNSIQIIRGKGGESPLLDAIVVSPNANDDPERTGGATTTIAVAPVAAAPAATQNQKASEAALPTNIPDANAAPLRLTASVDWNKTVAQAKPELWGVNDYEILTPTNAADPVYQEFLKSLNPALIRIHRSSISDSWTNAAMRSWDVEKIKAGFAASTGYGNAKVMLNIARVPTWLAKDRVLTPEQEDEFAQLCGQLVRIMRDEVKQPIAYWEMINEWDNSYERAGKLDDLWRVFNKITVEMRQQDPDIKIGGPAFTWPKPLWLEGFFKNCAQNVDFVTWHNYASGKPTTPNAEVFEKPSLFATYTRNVHEAARKHAPGRNLEFFLTEYNVQWTWEPLEVRHGNNIGAVFQASTLRHLALAGIDGVTLWHVKGSAYGIVGSDNAVRTTGHLYRWGVPYLTGAVAAGTSSDENALELFPIVRADGTRSLLLINKANRRVAIDGAKALLPAGSTVRAMRVDAAGHTTLDAKDFGGESWTLPGYSVTLLTTAS